MIVKETVTPTLTETNLVSYETELQEQKDAHWVKRQKELEERLKFLSSRKKDLNVQKIAIASPEQATKRRSKPVEEIQLILELTKAELKESHQRLQLERYKTDKLEEQLESWRLRCEHLEKDNRSFTLMLMEKDKLISSYLTELQSAKRHSESQGLNSNTIQLLHGLDIAMTRVEINEDGIGEESQIGLVGKAVGYRTKTNKITQQAELTLQRSQSSKPFGDEIGLSSLEVRERNLARLKALDFSNKSGESLVEKLPFLKLHQSELTPITPTKISADESQFFSPQIVKSSAIWRYGLQTEEDEPDALQKSKDNYEAEITKVDIRLKQTLKDLEAELRACRARVLQLIGEKAAQENELVTTRHEMKAIQSQFELKERKASELMTAIQDLKHESEIAKANKDRAVEKMQEALKKSSLYEGQITELKEEIAILTSKIASSERGKAELEDRATKLRREMEVAKADSSIHDNSELPSKERPDKARIIDIKKLLSCLYKLQDSDETLVALLRDLEEGELSLGPDILSIKKAEAQGRLQATTQLIQDSQNLVVSDSILLRESSGLPFAIDIEDLKLKISSQATELMSLKETIRLLNAQETNRFSANSLLSDRDSQLMAKENEMLKQELTKTYTSLEELRDLVGRLQASSNTEDIALFLQCSAAVVEELIHKQVVSND